MDISWAGHSCGCLTGPLDKTFKFYTGNMVGIVMGNDVLEVFSDFSGMRIPPNDLGDYQLYFIPGDYSTGRPQWIVRHLGYHDEEPDLVWEFDGRKTWVLQGDYEDEEY